MHWIIHWQKSQKYGSNFLIRNGISKNIYMILCNTKNSETRSSIIRGPTLGSWITFLFVVIFTSIPIIFTLASHKVMRSKKPGSTRYRNSENHDVFPQGYLIFWFQKTFETFSPVNEMLRFTYRSCWMSLIPPP